MANNYFNFKIPYFNEMYGNDWDDFITITDDAVDNIMNKTYQLYWLNDPNYYTTRVAEIVLDSLGLTYQATDTLATKKFMIRSFLTFFSNKGLADLYLDICEAIVGTRGAIYTGYDLARWNHFRWGPRKWTNQWTIAIDADTVDSGELDQIVSILQQDENLPAFYKLYIIDSSYNVLRTI